MNERLMHLQQQIAAEKDTRDIWIDRYEKEQKTHIATHTELVDVKGEMQQLTMQMDTQKANSELLINQNDAAKKDLVDLLDQFTTAQS